MYIDAGSNMLLELIAKGIECVKEYNGNEIYSSKKPMSTDDQILYLNTMQFGTADDRKNIIKAFKR